jgi:hypothetical protein
MECLSISSPLIEQRCGEHPRRQARPHRGDPHTGTLNFGAMHPYASGMTIAPSEAACG